MTLEKTMGIWEDGFGVDFEETRNIEREIVINEGKGIKVTMNAEGKIAGSTSTMLKAGGVVGLTASEKNKICIFKCSEIGNIGNCSFFVLFLF